MKTTLLTFILSIFIAFSGCSSTRVVLLDNDKEHNSIVVTTKAGSVVIDKPYESTTLTSSTSAPKALETVSKKELISANQDSFNTQSLKPVSFMLYFKTDSTEMVTASRSDFKKVIESLKSRQPCYVDIIGHTDTTGSKNYNMKLSLKRTKMVEKMILNNKIITSKINLEYYGENAPLVKTADGKASSKNRRVEILIR